MSENWSEPEVEAVVSDYLQMLLLERNGIPFNKAENNRLLRNIVTTRTRGSVERKHQNISAVLLELGYPYIDGYKPLGNYQEMLGRVVRERLVLLNEVQQTVEVAAVNNIVAIQVAPPERKDRKNALYERTVSAPPRPCRRNFIEMESRNRSLGLAGEQLALAFEHRRLWEAGERRLAEKIEHVSLTQGDGLGYDIHSFEVDGRDRFIEVKTTRFGLWTPFFASRNEVRVSEDREEEYQVYRVFGFEKAPQFFALRGSLRKSCLLDATEYAAVPR
jgi:hypothetical protein